MCQKTLFFECVETFRFECVALRSNFKYSRQFAGATTATTGAMQLARPACGDPVATQRTHGRTLYLKTDTTDLRACAHCARRCFFHSPKATHLRASASNTLKKRNVFLHILPIYERQRVTFTYHPPTKM
jgi:hypothetical protein